MQGAIIKAIDIIIVNWNAGDLLTKCLTSVARFEHGIVSKVVVVDNNSSDGSADGIESFNLPLEVIRNDENLGFAYACNQGAAICTARYLLFLNPDTEVYETSLIVPLAFMEHDDNSDVGICGIQLVDEKGHISRTCARFPSLSRFVAQAIGINKVPGFRSLGVHMQDWDHSQPGKVDHVIGAFFLVRRSLFDELKGFDVRYFVYLEDIDFSLRASKTGWKSMYLTDTQAYHAGGGTSRQVKDTRLFYSLRSRLLYAMKHFAAWQAWILLGITLVLEPLSRSTFSLLRGGVRDVGNTWRGYGMLYRDMPNILRVSCEKSQV